MIIKHSPIKHTIFLFLALWYELFFVLSIYDYLTSSQPHKDSSFFLLCLILATVGLLFILLCIRRLSVHSTIIAIDRQALTYYFSGLLAAKAYRIPLRQIARARYDQEINESEISLWMKDRFDHYEDFQHPRHHIFAYPDSRLISIVFKRKRLKKLENQGLDQLIYHYQHEAAAASQPAEPIQESKQEKGDSVFF